MKTTTHAKKPARPAAKGKGKKVPFRLKRKTNKPVSLVGSFTDWEKRPIELTEVEPGVWFAEVELPAGRHEYLFLSGGEWLPDPEAGTSVANPWGGFNSIIEVVVED